VGSFDLGRSARVPALLADLVDDLSGRASVGGLPMEDRGAPRASCHSRGSVARSSTSPLCADEEPRCVRKHEARVAVVEDLFVERHCDMHLQDFAASVELGHAGRQIVGPGLVAGERARIQGGHLLVGPHDRSCGEKHLFPTSVPAADLGDRCAEVHAAECRRARRCARAPIVARKTNAQAWHAAP